MGGLDWGNLKSGSANLLNIFYIQGRFSSVRFRKNNFANGLYAKCGIFCLDNDIKTSCMSTKNTIFAPKKAFFNRLQRATSVMAKNIKKKKNEKAVHKA